MSEKNPKIENLIWIDLEMTGLNPDRDHIIEIATVVTDTELNIIADGPALAIRQPESILALMDDWNVKQHNESGLIERVRTSNITEEQAQTETLEFLLKHVKAKTSPMCGNSVWQDRRFLFRWMPKLEEFFHYRLLDVSTLKIMAQLWAPKLYNGFKKESRHLAKDDVYDSIAELKYYRENLAKLQK